MWARSWENWRRDKKAFSRFMDKSNKQDQTTNTDHIQKLLHEMEIGNIDILIGTQIVTKGYHIPKRSLVSSWCRPWIFRRWCKICRKNISITGRAGREQNTKGKVLLQTYFPDNKALIPLAQGKEKEFIEMEMLSRKEAHMPPFIKMAVINLAGKYQEKTSP